MAKTPKAPIQYAKGQYVQGDTPAGDTLRERLGRLGMRRLVNRARVTQGRRPA